MSNCAYNHWTGWTQYALNEWSINSDKKAPFKNERCLDYIVKYIPSYVDSVYQFGCASGRDFLPFEGRMKLYGFDIFPSDKIRWIKNFDGLTYHPCCIEDFKSFVDEHLEFKDMSKSLVYTQGTLMYVKAQQQNDFFQFCRYLGCKNFIFNEYTEQEFRAHVKKPTLKNNGLYAQFDRPDEFIVRDYRESWVDHPHPFAHIMLDVDDATKKLIIDESVQ